MKVTKLIFKAMFFSMFILICIRAIVIYFQLYQAVNTNFSIDLRNRIVGTRIALLGKDPYFYVEQPGGDVRLLDPLNSKHSNFSRLTVTPAALILHAPYAWISFDKITKLWYIVQWILLFASIILMLEAYRKYVKFSLLIFAIFINSNFWILHLYYSQIYVLYLFLFVLIFYLLKKEKVNLVAFTLGILLLLRPTHFISLILLASLLKFNKTQYKYIFGGFITLLFTTIIIFTPSIWRQYIKSMSLMTTVPPMLEENYYGSVPQLDYPSVIEGWSVSQESLGWSPEYENSFKTFIYEHFDYTIDIYLLSLIVLIILATSYIYIKKNIHIKEFVLIMSIATTILVEYFMPMRRYQYADVQWLIILPLLIYFKEKLVRR